MSDQIIITPQEPQTIEISTGIKGDTATIAVGTVTTGEPGADAEVTNSGDTHDAVFDFILPLASTKYNIDAGTPFSVYGGIEENIDGGGP